MKPRYSCVPHAIDSDGRAHVTILQRHNSGRIDAGEITITSKVIRVNFDRAEIETQNSIYIWEQR